MGKTQGVREKKAWMGTWPLGSWKRQRYVTRIIYVFTWIVRFLYEGRSCGTLKFWKLNF